MGRLLDDDMVVKVLGRWQEAFRENSHYASASDLSLVAKDIKALPPVQPEPPWIPVSERLPEESGWYICTCRDGVSERVTFLKWQKRLKQWEKTGTRSYWKVIAWMPLPEAYQKGAANA